MHEEPMKGVVHKAFGRDLILNCLECCFFVLFFIVSKYVTPLLGVKVVV